jgi:negative regulator of sigma E activity
MTDDAHLDDASLDELVSAHLDGESTEEEAALVRGDAELRARLDAFGAARDAVRAEVAVPTDEARDALLARVIGTAIAPDNVVAMGARRRVNAKVLAVAAAVIAVAFLGGALALLNGSRDGSDSDSAATSRDQTRLAYGEDAGGAPATTAAGNQATGEQDLGDFADAAALRDALDQRLSAMSAPTAADSAAESGPAETSSGTSPPASPELAPICPANGATPYRAVLTGQPVLVLVTAGTVTVLSPTDCTTITSFTR